MKIRLARKLIRRYGWGGYAMVRGTTWRRAMLRTRFGTFAAPPPIRAEETPR